MYVRHIEWHISVHLLCFALFHTSYQIMSGASDYFSYEWTDSSHYITSMDDFNQDSGWTNPINTDYVREKIPESGFNVRADEHMHVYNTWEGG